MTTLLTILLVLGVSHTAHAQHYCDTTPPTTGTSSPTTPLFAEFCIPKTDTIDAVTVYRGTTPTLLSALELVTATASATGLMHYRVSLGLLPAGTHTVRLSAWNKTAAGVAQEGAQSSPFMLTVAIPLPAPGAPTKLRVRP